MDQKSVEITILHTNDMHGRLEAMTQLSTRVRELRAQLEASGRQVFYWDAGDAADRRIRVVSLSKGAAFMPVLNAMGIQLQTLGNDLALTYGPQVMQAAARRADFPILAANLQDGDARLPPGLRESLLIPVGDQWSLGVFGLTAPWGGLYEMFGYQLPDAKLIATRLNQSLRDQGASVIVCLSHLGIMDDRLLVEEVSGLDLVIGGHSHTLLPEGEVHNGVLIAQAGEYAQYLGQVDIRLDVSTGQPVSVKASVHPIHESLQPDPAVIAAIKMAEAEVDLLLVRQVASLAAPMDLDHFHECSLGNLAADALRERMQADLAVIAAGNFHKGLPAGEVTLGQLNEACFSTANPGVSLLLGRQILAMLESSLDPEIQKVTFSGLRGVPLGCLQISGLRVWYSPGRTGTPKIRRAEIQSELIDPERVYQVAHTDVETHRDLYFRLEAGKKPQYEVPTILPEVLIDYFQAHWPVQPPDTGRWIPVED